MKLLRAMLVFIPLALVADYVLHKPLLVFLFAAAGLVPLAGLLGEATEHLAERVGPKIGGLLNATLGNAAELIITIVALKAGKVELVKASITGSILGNVLLILGFALLFGGLKNGVQKFDQGIAGMSSTMMLLSVIGMLIPTFFEVIHRIQHGMSPLKEAPDPALDRLSLGVAGLLILTYGLSLIFTLKGGTSSAVEPKPHAAAPHESWSTKKSVIVLTVATIAIVFLSEILVGAVEPVVRDFGISELFLGVILIPLVGNVAEHLVAVQAAYKNDMDLSLSISLGSSMQIALFVAPLLTFVSLLFGKEMTLFFSPFEVVVLTVSVLIAGDIASDGESNWLEGAQLLVVYAIAGMGFFWL